MDNYIQLRDSGLVVVASANGSPAILVQKFDANTGAPVGIEEQTVNLDALQSELDSMAARQADITALISDSQANGLADIAVAKDTMTATIASTYASIIEKISPPIRINPAQQVSP